MDASSVKYLKASEMESFRLQELITERIYLAVFKKINAKRL